MKGESEGKFFGKKNSIDFLSLRTPQATLSKICSLIIFVLTRSDLLHEKNYSSYALPQVVFFVILELLPHFAMLRNLPVGTFHKTQNTKQKPSQRKLEAMLQKVLTSSLPLSMKHSGVLQEDSNPAVKRDCAKARSLYLYDNH